MKTARETDKKDEQTIHSATTGHWDDSSEIQELRHRIQELQTEFEHADRRLREVVRGRPLAAIATAVAAGFLLGRIIRRV